MACIPKSPQLPIVNTVQSPMPLNPREHRQVRIARSSHASDPFTGQDARRVFAPQSGAIVRQSVRGATPYTTRRSLFPEHLSSATTASAESVDRTSEGGASGRRRTSHSPIIRRQHACARCHPFHLRHTGVLVRRSSGRVRGTTSISYPTTSASRTASSATTGVEDSVHSSIGERGTHDHRAAIRHPQPPGRSEWEVLPNFLSQTVTRQGQF